MGVYVRFMYIGLFMDDISFVSGVLVVLKRVSFMFLWDGRLRMPVARGSWSLGRWDQFFDGNMGNICTSSMIGGSAI